MAARLIPTISARPAMRVVVLVVALALPASAPPATASAASAFTSQSIVSLVNYVAGLASRLSATERRAMPTLAADIAKLKADASRAQSTGNERLAAQVKARVHALSLKLTDLPAVTRQDEFGVRTEPDMGTPDCREQDRGETWCSGNGWLSTRSRNFVNIKKRSFHISIDEYPQGIRVNASFVAENDDTTMSALFSAESYVATDPGSTSARLFVRALLDGKPAAPSDVVFATTEHHGLRQMLFTSKVSAGIHTVEMQWLVDPGGTAYIRDANLLVRTGRSLPSAKGTLTAQTPKSGPNLEKSTDIWQDVPGTSLWFWAPRDAVTTVTFAAEAFVDGGKAIAARALIDNAAILPSDVVFARGTSRQSRGFTFGRIGLAQGWHSARVQWSVEPGGHGTLGDRSISVASYPSPTAAPSHPFVAAPSGPSYVLPVNGPQVLPGMTTPITIPAKGNGEVAVIFSAEVVSTAEATVMLDVDGAIKFDTLATLTDGGVAGQSKGYVLEAKHLTPGPHTLTIIVGGTAGVTQFGDRTIAVMSETGYVPDLAEAPRLTGGRVLTRHVGVIEPLLGPHNVLTILFDPNDCATSSDPGCVDENDFTPADVTQALYGPGDNANGLFASMSGGRFSIVNAGVLGWYHSQHPHDYYWDGAWDSCDHNDSGFSSGHAARLWESVVAAKDDVDFASFDVNGDGELDSHELAIIVVWPQNTSLGSSLAELLSAQCPNAQRLTLDGVVLPRWISGWYADFDNNTETYQFSNGAHELLHQWTRLDDIYVGIGNDHATFPRKLTLMSDNHSSTTHLDPVQKLALGWVTPRLVDSTTQLSLMKVEQTNHVVVLPRYNGPAQGEEYYVLENRRQDAGANQYDDGILDSGIAVWHTTSDQTDAAKHAIGVTQASWDTTAANLTADDIVGNGTMGRWGIRLLRPWVALTMAGVAVFPDADKDGNADKDDTLWDNAKYALVSAPCPAVFLGEKFAAHNVLAWADCTASGYGVRVLSAPAASMTVKIDAP